MLRGTERKPKQAWRDHWGDEISQLPLHHHLLKFIIIIITNFSIPRRTIENFMKSVHENTTKYLTRLITNKSKLDNSTLTLFLDHIEPTFRKESKYTLSCIMARSFLSIRRTGFHHVGARTLTFLFLFFLITLFTLLISSVSVTTSWWFAKEKTSGLDDCTPF